jgi:hypothetical protein
MSEENTSTSGSASTGLRARILAKIRGYRTMISAVGLGVGGVLLTLWDQIQAAGIDVKALLGDWIPVQYVGLAFVVISVAFGYLRIISTNPWGKSEPQERAQVNAGLSLLGFIPGLVKPILDYFTARQNAQVQMYMAKTGADRDTAVAALQATTSIQTRWWFVAMPSSPSSRPRSWSTPGRWCSGTRWVRCGSPATPTTPTRSPAQ